MRLIRILKVSPRSSWWPQKHRFENQVFFSPDDCKKNINGSINILDPLKINLTWGRTNILVDEYEEYKDGTTDPGAHDQQGAD